MPFMFLFIIIPLIELYLFLTVGSQIGILNTLLICLVTAIVGGYLVRKQGIETLLAAKTNLQTGKLPMKELFTGFCLVIAGALLMTPGFFTDFIGFLLLIPFLRDILKDKLVQSGKFQFYTADNNQTYTRKDESVIDGDYETVHPEAERIDESDDHERER